MHYNCGVEAFDIFSALYKIAPPSLLYIITKLHAQWAVVVETVVTAIDFGRGKDETPAFAQSYYLFH